MHTTGHVVKQHPAPPSVQASSGSTSLILANAATQDGDGLMNFEEYVALVRLQAVPWWHFGLLGKWACVVICAQRP